METSDLKAGQFGVIATDDWAGRLIRFGTRSSVNHAVLFLGDGKIIEAEPHGARIRKLRDGEVDDYTWSGIELTDEQRNKLVAFAKLLRGIPYGWWSVIKIGLTAIGFRFKFLQEDGGIPRELMCSQLVSYAYLAALGIDLCPHKPSASESPGDLLDCIEHETIPEWW